MIQGDTVDNRPVDFLIVMHGNVSKAHGLLQLLGQRLGDGTGVGQRIEGLAHRIWWQHIQVGNEVRVKVHHSCTTLVKLRVTIS